MTHLLSIHSFIRSSPVLVILRVIPFILILVLIYSPDSTPLRTYVNALSCDVLVELRTCDSVTSHGLFSIHSLFVACRDSPKGEQCPAHSLSARVGPVLVWLSVSVSAFVIYIFTDSCTYL